MGNRACALDEERSRNRRTGNPANLIIQDLTHFFTARSIPLPSVVPYGHPGPICKMLDMRADSILRQAAPSRYFDLNLEPIEPTQPRHLEGALK